MTTMTPVTATAPMPSSRAVSGRLGHLLAACRLEDGVRWALVGAVVAAGILAALSL